LSPVRTSTIARSSADCTAEATSGGVVGVVVSYLTAGGGNPMGLNFAPCLTRHAHSSTRCSLAQRLNSADTATPPQVGRCFVVRTAAHP
jgi:hypothetical protein